jgi:four helix bundle protein
MDLSLGVATARRSSFDAPGGKATMLPFQRLDVYVAARELARLVHVAKIGDAELRDQATRAAKSTFLHLCEGLPNESAAMRNRYFVGANNSLREVVGAVDLAVVIEVIATEDAQAIQALAERVKRMLRGLLRPRS